MRIAYLMAVGLLSFSTLPAAADSAFDIMNDSSQTIYGIFLDHSPTDEELGTNYLTQDELAPQSASTIEGDIEG